MGITIKHIITYASMGTKNISGINLKKYSIIIAAIETGRVSKVAKNIKET